MKVMKVLLKTNKNPDDEITFKNGEIEISDHSDYKVVDIQSDSSREILKKLRETSEYVKYNYYWFFTQEDMERYEGQTLQLPYDIVDMIICAITFNQRLFDQTIPPEKIVVDLMNLDDSIRSKIMIAFAEGDDKDLAEVVTDCFKNLDIDSIPKELTSAMLKEFKRREAVQKAAVEPVMKKIKEELKSENPNIKEASEEEDDFGELDLDFDDLENEEE